MRPFSDEAERSAQVATELEPFFNVAEALHNSWLTHAKDEWLRKSKLQRQALNVAVMLDVQASRLFRSVIEECRRCEAYGANIISRSLFETVLAIRFVLGAKRLQMAVDQAKTKGGAPKVDAAGKPVYYSKPVDSSTSPALTCRLTRKQRADLYLAHALFQDERGAEKLAALPRMKRRVAKLQARGKALIAQVENKIGPEWTSVLRSTRAYSGLSVEVLSKLMGKPFERWYLTVYYFQSRNVHAVDPLRNVSVSEDKGITATYLSTVGQVRQVLTTAITMFLIAIATLQNVVKFGPDVDIAYESIRRRYRAQIGKS